jgi:hypothetical protein
MNDILIEKRLCRVSHLMRREVLAFQQNLFEAYGKFRESRVLALWIDAICIGQENQEELKRQLSLMPYIYCDASRGYLARGGRCDDPRSRPVSGRLTT